MTGLVLKLAPCERVLINGAVIENGDKRSRLAILTPNAHILRLRDAIHPEEVNTPVRRVCYIAQLVLSGDADPKEARHQIIRGIEQLSQVFTDHDSRLRQRRCRSESGRIDGDASGRAVGEVSRGDPAFRDSHLRDRNQVQRRGDCGGSRRCRNRTN